MTTFELFPTPIKAYPRLPERREALPLDSLADAIIRPSIPASKGSAFPVDHPLLLVTTGQQAGLFTGPLYTIYKALSAAALAELLSERWGQEVRACFWIPGDDHDYAEVAAASWVDSQGKLVTVKLPDRPPEFGLRPMYQERLPDDVIAASEKMGGDLVGGIFAHETIEWLTRCYRPGATFARAFGQAMADLLAQFGVLCLDGSHHSVKKQAAPLIVSYLDNITEVSDALSQNQSSDGAGIGVEPLGDAVAALVFMEDEAGRDRLIYQSGNFIGRRTGRQYSHATLRNLVLDRPELFSANVTLRPVVESFVLPTVAYVGGPAELGYLNQSALVAKVLRVPIQRAVPRWSGVIAEAPVQRILNKFGVPIGDFIATANTIENEILTSAFPDDVYDMMASLARLLKESYTAIGAAVTAIDPTMDGPVAAAGRQSDWALKDLTRQVLRSAKRKQSTELSQLRRVKEMLMPGGGAQERKLTIAPFLSHQGPGLLKAIFDTARAYYRELFTEEIRGSRYVSER